jgi:hypothetical protein
VFVLRISDAPKILTIENNYFFCYVAIAAELSVLLIDVLTRRMITFVNVLKTIFKNIEKIRI